MNGLALVGALVFVLFVVGGYMYERDAHAYLRVPPERKEPK